jgi:hypothetical protein
MSGFGAVGDGRVLGSVARPVSPTVGDADLGAPAPRRFCVDTGEWQSAQWRDGQRALPFRGSPIARDHPPAPRGSVHRGPVHLAAVRVVAQACGWAQGRRPAPLAALAAAAPTSARRLLVGRPESRLGTGSALLLDASRQSKRLNERVVSVTGIRLCTGLSTGTGDRGNAMREMLHERCD